MKPVCQQIKNPITGRMINVNKKVYTNLIKNNEYVDLLLINNDKNTQKLTQSNENLITQDILYNSLLQSDYDTMRNLFLVNITCINIGNNYFWFNKFKYDNLPILNNNKLYNINTCMREYKNIVTVKNTVHNIIHSVSLKFKSSIINRLVSTNISILEDKIILHNLLSNIISFSKEKPGFVLKPNDDITTKPDTNIIIQSMSIYYLSLGFETKPGFSLE